MITILGVGVGVKGARRPIVPAWGISSEALQIWRTLSNEKFG